MVSILFTRKSILMTEMGFHSILLPKMSNKYVDRSNYFNVKSMIDFRHDLGHSDHSKGIAYDALQ